MDNSALTDFPELNLEPIRDIEDEVVIAAEDSDRELGSLLAHRGWQRIATEMKADIDKLRNLTGADVSGKDFAEIGQKFLVSSLTADHLQKYLEKIENAAKAVADAERAKQPK